MQNLEKTKLCLTINLDNIPENIEFKDGEKSPHFAKFAFFPNKIIINNKRKHDNTEIITPYAQKRAKNGID